MAAPKNFVCRINNCNKAFTRKYSLTQHQRTHQREIPLERCVLCGQLFNNCDELQQHYPIAHPPSRRFVVRESAFRRKFVTYRYNFLPDQKDFPEAQRSIKNIIIRQIMGEAAQKLITRVALIFIAEMVAEDHSGERMQNAVISFRAPTFYANANNPRHIERMVRHSFASQIAHLDDFIRSGSNWRFERALAFDIEISAVKPVRGGCNSLSTQKWKNKTHLYSPENNDNKCFLYCIAYFLLFGIISCKQLPIDYNSKVEKKVRSFNTKGIEFPIRVKDIQKFTRRNSNLDLSINILYRTLNDVVYPLEYGIGKGNVKVNLLLVETNSGGHYMLIKNTDLYLRRVVKDPSNLTRYRTAFFCKNCLSAFYLKEVRDRHENACIINRPRLEKTPDKGKNWIRFKNYERKHWLEFIAYLDFECVLPDVSEKCEFCPTLKCKCDKYQSSTKVVNNQLPICYSFVVLDNYDSVIHEHTYAGQDAHLNFMEHLLDQEDAWIASLLKTELPIVMTFRDNANFNNSTSCYICNKPFTADVVKCRDHCHFSGKYLGAACSYCNLRRTKPRTLKIFIHNASKYDMHFLVKAIPNFRDRIKNIRVLPYNGENFRTMSFNNFEILDSLSFLQASLAQLSSDLKLTNHNYHILKQTYLVREKGSYSKQKLEMVLSKSFFPYEYCKSYEQMMDTKRLPKIRRFYSSLSEKSITKEDHNFARKVWKSYQCKNLVDYCKLYCKIDVLLLAEVFQKFRKEMMAFSSLDPAHYISLPAYGYDSMLYITKAWIELPTDIDMVLFLEQAKRGGVSFVNNRYLSVGKIGKEGKQKTEEEIVYIDANNLYGNAQMQKLPLKGFRWLDDEEIENFNVHLDANNQFGYFVECDLHYPSHLHSKHSNFPLCPEILEVNYDNLSPYVKKAIFETEGKKQYSDVKLMSTFHDKTNYVTHIKNLQLYLSLGIELIKIHRVLEFKQAALLKPYIEKTTAARQKAESKFQMDLFKKLVSIKSCSHIKHLSPTLFDKFELT